MFFAFINHPIVSQESNAGNVLFRETLTLFSTIYNSFEVIIFTAQQTPSPSYALKIMLEDSSSAIIFIVLHIKNV